MISWLFAASLCAAADHALPIERGWASLDAQRAAEAAALAAPWVDHPEGAQLYVAASVALGRGHVAALEVADRLTAPPWSNDLRALQDALKGQRPMELKPAVRALRGAFPRRPELMAAVFEGPDSKEAEHERARIRRDLQRRIRKAAGDADIVFLYRARRLLLSADPGRVESVNTALTALGEPAPVGPRWNHDERTARAEDLVELGPPFPVGRLVELLDIVQQAADEHEEAGDLEAAMDLWEALSLQHRHPAVIVHAAAWGARVGTLEGIRELGDLALREVLTADDLAPFSLRELSAEALEASALAETDPLQSVRRLVIAELLRPSTALEALRAQHDAAIVKAEEQLSAQYGIHGDTAAHALDQAADAVRAGQGTRAIEVVEDALIATAAVDDRPTRMRLVARALEISSEALASTGDAKRAYGLARLGTELQNTTADDALRLAALSKQAGSADAFRWLVMAGAAGAPTDAAGLEAAYQGPGTPAAARAAWLAPAPTLGEATGSVPEPGQALKWTIDDSSDTPFAEDGLELPSVVAFWSVFDPESLLMVHELDEVARTLRREGLHMAVVAVSVDRGEPWRAGEPVQRALGLCCERAPWLPAQLGVSELPAAIVLGRDGLVRYTLDTRPDFGAAERLLRRAAEGG
jgi:hypothetical protein